MQFQHAIIIDTSPEVVWSFLWDVERLARCIPGCEQAEVVVPHERYTALITDRVGPLKLKMPMSLVVQDADAPRRLHVVGTGKDSALGSNVRVDIHVELSESGASTSVQLTVDAAVSGKIAGLGMGLFKRKFDDIMNQFTAGVKVAIEGAQQSAPAG